MIITILNQKFKELIIKINFKKIDFITILKRSILFIIPFIIIYIFLFNYIKKIEVEKSIEIIVSEQKQKTNTLDYIIKNLFDESIEDLLVIKKSDEINNYINDTTQFNQNELSQLFYRIASNKSSFDQIRYIDTNGQEIIRVNNSDNSPYIVSSDLLQNKFDRYYFKESIKLNDGEYYFSNLDLNIENGKIEEPYKPVIRIATPLYNLKNELKGILIINYLGENIIGVFNNQYNISNNNMNDTYLINNEGYFLYNKDISKTFSYMFDNEKQYNFKDLNNIVYDYIIKNHNGYIIDNNYIYYFKEIIPTSNIENVMSDKFSWYIISDYNLNNFPVIKKSIFFYLSLMDLLVLVILCILIFFSILITYLRNKDKEQLLITNKIAENTNDAILITDKFTKIIFVNKAFEQITGYSKDEVLGLKTNYFKSGLHKKNFYQQMWKELNETGSWEGELWDRKKDGLFYPKLLKILAINKKLTNKVDKYIGIYFDLTRLKQDEEDITKLKNYNIETNLPNEKLLLKLLQSNVESTKNNIFGLFCFSIINYYDLINNRGDEEIRKAIKEFIKDINTLISKNDFIAQISKNTFVIGLVNYESKSEIKNFIDIFFNYNKESLNDQKDCCYFQIKAGVSTYSKNTINPKELLRDANIALEVAKTNNTIDYLFSSSELTNEVNHKMELSILLRKAIINDELDVHYQPQIDCNSNKIIGVEALIRWNNKKFGNIGPFEFIPIAEKTGFIIDLGYWLIERIFQDYNKIKYIIPNDFKISINISALQFQDNKLVKIFTDLSKQYDVNLNKIEIEITESILVNDINIVNSQLKKFKNLGISISLDDFGTGFSSLSYLKMIIIDKIKIDRKFIKDYPEYDNGGLAKIIVQLAKELDLKVITEGVETKIQLDYIKSIGCNYIQGYYYSKPLTFDDLILYIKKKRE